MNISEIVEELRNIEPDIPLDKKDKIVGFHIIETDGLEIFFLDYGDEEAKDLNTKDMN